MLVCGESGTGKELVARLVHALDPQRCHGPFVVVDCASIVATLSAPELFGHERGAFTGAHTARQGAFGQADRGVLFLDEIGELPGPLQPELLRVLQERTFKPLGSSQWHKTDFRLVCATNRDLGELERAGRFRRDLRARLSAVTVALPSLADRAEDIPLLVRHFLTQLLGGQAPELDPAVETYLMTRSYPGNVRELRQLVAQLSVRYVGTGRLTIGMIPEGERPQHQDQLSPFGYLQGLRTAVSEALTCGTDLRYRPARAEVDGRVAGGGGRAGRSRRKRRGCCAAAGRHHPGVAAAAFRRGSRGQRLRRRHPRGSVPVTAPGLTLAPRPEVAVGVSASAVVGAQLLVLPVPELERRVVEEAERNPALSVRLRPCCLRCGGSLITGRCRRCGGRSSTESWPEHLTAATSAVDQLLRDALEVVPTALAPMVGAVVAALDGRGLLDAQARAELADAGVDRAELAVVVEALRTVGPPGVAAATVAQNLLLQLDAAPLAATEKALARLLLTEHAADLEAGRLESAAAALGRPVHELEALLDRMRRLLRPYPGLDGPGREVSAMPPAPPDLVFEADEGGRAVRVELPERSRLLVEVDTSYRRLAGEAGPRARDHLRQARTFVSHLERRWSTLGGIGRLLAERHAPQLLAGSTAFVRLTRVEAADRLGVHPSTVSRAVQHRRARLPDGSVVALHSLFGTAHDVRAVIAELSQGVPRLSDRAIAELLAGRGYRVARRTVTKHRLALGIAAR